MIALQFVHSLGCHICSLEKPGNFKVTAFVVNSSAVHRRMFQEFKNWMSPLENVAFGTYQCNYLLRAEIGQRNLAVRRGHGLKGVIMSQFCTVRVICTKPRSQQNPRRFRQKRNKPLPPNKGTHLGFDRVPSYKRGSASQRHSLRQTGRIPSPILSLIVGNFRAFPLLL